MADTFDGSVERIATESKVLTDFFNENGYYAPAFAQGGFNEFDELPAEVEAARNNLRAAAKILHDLVAGPTDHVKALAQSFHDTSTLRWLVHYGIPEAVPLRGSISYGQVAGACHVHESRLRRIVRYAMTNHLFAETSADEIAHTAYSAILVTDPEIRDRVKFTCDEMFPPSAKLVEAHETWPNSEARNRAAFQLAWNTTLPVADYLTQPGLEERAEAYKMASELPEYGLQHTIEGYDWSRVKRVVDIGGGSGQTAIALARKFPNLRIMVEDQPEVFETGQTELPAELAHKVYPVEHDFFKPQPDEVSGSEVYLLRNVLHRYSDGHATQILENLVELLLDGAKLVIVDAILAPPGVALSVVEKQQRGLDLEVMQTHNGKERQLDEWEALLRGVDPDLKIVSVRQPEGSLLSIMEVALNASL